MKRFLLVVSFVSLVSTVGAVEPHYCFVGGYPTRDDTVNVHITITGGDGIGDGYYSLVYGNPSGNYGYIADVGVSGGLITVNSFVDWFAAYASYGNYDGYLFLAQNPSWGAAHVGWNVSEECGSGSQSLIENVTLHVSGVVPPPDENQTKPCSANTDCADCSSRGMAKYWLHLMLASLHIEDTPISYKSPRGASIDFKAVYNHREANQPATFSYSNLGPKWTFNWLSYVTDNGPSGPAANPTVCVRGGGTESFSGYDPATQSYRREDESFAVLVRTSNSSYEKRFPDGSAEIFSASDNASSYPRRVFLSSVVDPVGNTVRLDYDTSFRITAITDESTNQSVTLSYTGADLKIAKVTDPFGRFATFDYNDGKLAKITDPMLIESGFDYAPGSDFINSLTTPYGTTTFAGGQTANTYRWIEATDPLGGKERIEYQDSVAAIPSSEPVAPAGVDNSQLNRRNTFYWDKKAMAEAPGDYTKARIIHWLRTAGDGTKISGFKHSEKYPLENRVWYLYEDQSDSQRAGDSAKPSTIARLLGDGTTSVRRYEYNDFGNTTKMIDPVNRVTSYVYKPNQIDLWKVFQRHLAAEGDSGGASLDPDGAQADLIESYEYDPSEPAHRPAVARDAAQQPTTFHYNASGQVLWMENARQETTTYAYGDGTAGKPLGYLTSVTSPSVAGVSAIVNYAYDPAAPHRVRTITQVSDGNYSVTTDYDNLDRPTVVTFPDLTHQEFHYTRYDASHQDTGIQTLDLTASRDRRGLWTYRDYDGVRRMTALTDPENRKTQYGWCSCGSLDSVTDAENHITTFTRDVRGRVTRKEYADHTGIDYLYDGQSGPSNQGATSRVASMTDAKGQRINYRYFADDNLAETSYTTTSGAPLFPVTPTVTYAYDPNYNRVTGMDDGTGHTNYAYHPVAAAPTLGANRLWTVDGPLGNDVITYSYDELGRGTRQSINGVAATMHYDAQNRADTETNDVLGNFSRTFFPGTSRIQSMTAAANGQVGTYQYFGGTADRRLQYLESHQAGGPNLSRFDYTYDPEGEIQTWNKLLGTTQSKLWMDYDNAQQLRSAHNAQQILSSTYAFDSGYDLAGNRLSDQIYNPSLDIGGGTSHQYAANNLNQLKQRTTTTNGIPGPTVSLQYDPVGNMIYDASNQTFEWDAANRLVAINYLASGQRSEFAYDGANRRTQITERGAGQTAVAQPASAETYSVYTSAPFTATAGNFTIRFEGLRSGATALLDAVTLNGATVANGSFETPAVGANVAPNPANATWAFTGEAGIAGNGSGFPDAPNGTQVGYVQNDTGVIQQTVALTAGVYTLAFKAAQGPENKTPQQVRATIEKTGQTTSVQRFVWNGNTIAEERDSTGATVMKRFFPEGEQRWNEKLQAMEAFYYTRDHLGSIREVTDATGNLRARYDYDVWGNSVVLEGDMSLDFGYTGHFFHAPSGLNLTLYRAYSATMGRWLSRDPIGEQGGTNYYRYCDNAPTIETDPLGLFSPGGFILPPIVEPYVPFSPPVPFVPTPLNPDQPNSARRWFCSATCNVEVFNPDLCPNAPARVSGLGEGPSEEEACRNAKRDAGQKAPPGSYPRHCKCNCSYGRFI